MGRENLEKKNVVKDTEKKQKKIFFVFLFEKYLNRSDL